MAIDRLPETASNLPAGFADRIGQRRLRYDCELGGQHVDAALLPPIRVRHARAQYDLWARSSDTDDRVGHVARWIDHTIKQMPSGIDVARDVDGGGFTHDFITPTMFTGWVAVAGDTHARFSRSRTAMHTNMLSTAGMTGGGALRSPVMGGVVLEATNNPNSLDPRDAVSLVIFGFSRDEDARFPWLKPRPGQLFDMTPFTDKPYFVGPLYNGHPNEVTNASDVQYAVDAATAVLRLTVASQAGAER